RDLVNRSVKRDRYPGGVVLTGGAALTRGLDEMAARIFRRDARLGAPGPVSGPAACPDSPIYATGLGLLLHGLQEARDPLMAERSERILGRVYEKFAKMIDWYS